MMKTKTTLLAGVALAAWTLGSLTTALAQGPPPSGGGGGNCPSSGGGGSGGGGGGTPPGGPDEERGGLPDLGKAADRFEAWKIANLDGAQSFSKYQADIRQKYEDLIDKIEKATLEDRLDGQDARRFLLQALKVNATAAKGGATVSDQVVALDSAVEAALTDGAKAETLTPKLNKLQWLINETLIYGSMSKEMSAAKVSSINKKLIALEEKEAQAKEDGRLTDLERKRLDEGTMKIWKLMVKGLKGRND